jgi:hypothetical protein
LVGALEVASDALRGRANWQTISGARALDAETSFREALQTALDSAHPGQFTVGKPLEFKNIYSRHPLPKETLEKIHDVSMQKPDGTPRYSWGISMDFCVENLRNNKKLFGEIKRQDGWVETTEPSAGRGNAHERSTKYFTPGLIQALREEGNLGDDVLPFWLVFIGDITRDPRRNREIAFWFQGHESHYFMWRDETDLDSILDHFQNKLLPHLL